VGVRLPLLAPCRTLRQASAERRGACPLAVRGESPLTRTTCPRRGAAHGRLPTCGASSARCSSASLSARRADFPLTMIPLSCGWAACTQGSPADARTITLRRPARCLSGNGRPLACHSCVSRLDSAQGRDPGTMRPMTPVKGSATARKHPRSHRDGNHPGCEISRRCPPPATDPSTPLAGHHHRPPLPHGQPAWRVSRRRVARADGPGKGTLS